MPSNAVRELITKIKFVTDGSGLNAAQTKVQDFKNRMKDVANNKIRIETDSTKLDATRNKLQDFREQMRTWREKIRIDVDTSKLDAVREKLDTMGSRIASAGRTLSMAGAGLLGAVALPVKTAAEFEATMSKVKAITGSTDEEMQRLTQTARQLGRDTVFSASEAGEAMTYLGMAGWKTEQIIAGMPGLLDLATASGGNFARVADIISDDLTAFGMAAGQASHMADVFAATSMNANTNVELMGYTFKYVGAVCGALGYSIEDAALATGLLASASIKGEQAGTYLRAIITRLISPTKEAAVAMQELGIQVANSDGSMKPLRQTLLDLRKAFSGLTKEEQAQKAESLAGKEAITGLLTLVNAADEDFNKLAGAIDNSNGAAKRFAEISKQNFYGALKELKSAIEEVFIALGNTLLPVLSNATKSIREFTNSFSGFIKEHPKLVAALMGSAAALGVLFVGLGTIGIFVGGIMQLGAVLLGLAPILSTVTGAIGSFIGALAGLPATAAGGILAIFTKITALPAMLTGLVAKLTAIPTLLTGLFSGGMGGALSGVFAAVISGGKFLLGLLNPLTVALTLVAGAIGFIGENWELVYSWLAPGLQMLSEGVNEFAQAFGKLWDAIQPIIPPLWEIIKIVGGLLVAALIAFFDVGAFVFKTIASLVNVLADAINALKGPISAVADMLSGLIDSAKTFLGFKGEFGAVDATARDVEHGGGGNSVTFTQTNNFQAPPEEQGQIASEAANDLMPTYAGE